MSLLRRALVALAATSASLAGVALAPTVAAPLPIRARCTCSATRPSGNRVLVFDAAPDGTLTAAGSVDAGGVGTGGGLGSQGAIVTDDAGRYVYAVNAGSNTIAAVPRDVRTGSTRIDVVASGGSMPTSLTVHEMCSMSSTPAAPARSSASPSTTAISSSCPGRPARSAAPPPRPRRCRSPPTGDQLVVTERATQRIDLYAVGGDGYATGPTIVDSVGVTPFGFGFDNKGHLVVSEAFGGAADAERGVDVRRRCRVAGDGQASVADHRDRRVLDRGDRQRPLRLRRQRRRFGDRLQRRAGRHADDPRRRWPHGGPGCGCARSRHQPQRPVPLRPAGQRHGRRLGDRCRRAR